MTPAVVREESRFEGFSVLEFEQPAGVRVPRHAHDATTLFCVAGGEALDHIGAKAFPMARGSVLLRPRGAAHTHEYPAPLHGIAISIGDSGIDTLRLPSSPAFAVAPPLVRSLLSELHFVDAIRSIAVASLVAEIGTHLRRERCAAPWLLRIREMLHDESEKRLSLASLAAAAGVHPGHAARSFREHFGSSIAAYSREVRLRRAARALIASDETVAEIATAFGFCDQSHFDRLFRRRFGATPMAWRATFGLSKRTRSAEAKMKR